MRATAQQKLGQESGAWMKVFGLGFATEVELLPNEIPLRAWDVAFQGNWVSGAWGVLYLTKQRLVFIRWRLAAPWLAKTIVVHLESVSDAIVQRKLATGLIEVVNVRLKNGRQLLFMPASIGPAPNEIISEIGAVLRERGLLDA